VSVPVLSVQITVADPSASTDSSRRISALWSAIRCAACANESVTVGSSPSGTSATVTPTAIRNAAVNSIPSHSAAPKNATPTPTADEGARVGGGARPRSRRNALAGEHRLVDRQLGHVLEHEVGAD